MDQTARQSDAQQQKMEQLQSLLLLISETSFDTFTMMGEPCQKSVLTLAYDLSLAAAH